MDNQNNMENKNTEIEKYNYNQPVPLTKDRKKTFSAILDNLSRLATESFSSYTFSKSRIKLEKLEEKTFEEQINELPQDTFYALVKMKPMDKHIVFGVSAHILNAQIDLLLGSGKASSDESNFNAEKSSLMELAIVKNIYEKFLNDVKYAFTDYIEEFEPEIVKIYQDITRIETIAKDERIYDAEYSFNIDNLEGKMFVCFPYTSILPIKEKLSEKFLFQPVEKKSSRYIDDLKKQVDTTYIYLSGQIDSKVYTLEQILQLKEGDVIELCSKEGDAYACVNLKRTFKVYIGRHGEKWACKIIDFV